MRLLKLFITGFLFFIFLFVSSVPTHAQDLKVVHFTDSQCLVCKELVGYVNGTYDESEDYIQKIKDAGITVESYDILTSAENADLFTSYKITYNVEKDAAVPIIFAGDQAFVGLDEIRTAFDDGTIQTLSSEPLLDVSIIEGSTYNNITGIIGFLTVLAAGFLDGFNPCAIAMLLLFVSLLGFSENKRVLILVSITYIFALFISYFLIGTFLLNFLIQFKEEAEIINKIISWFVAILCSFLFLFNLYDFFMTRNDRYEKVKNQLPKFIQKFNKKIIKRFTAIINDDTNKKGLFSVLILTFILGILLSVTELICTGQIYLGIIYGIHYLDTFYAYIALISYNIMFVVPLIAIAVIAIKGKGIVSTSNWIREHMHIIKFFNAMLFLVIAIYYFTRIF
jgi:hypothetical protein